jgi:acetoin:2,6-dichlorophenolindophenol oxidoreductase subunit alpha
MKTECQKLPLNTFKQLLFNTLKIRRVEEEIARLYPAQEIRCPVHLCNGQEAIPAGVCQAMGKSDIVFGSHRAHGYYIARGGSLKAFMAELYGKASGCGKGKSGSQHFAAPEVGFMGSSAIVAGTVPIAAGAALSFTLQHKKSVAVVDFGDGATDEGTFYEALNFSALKKLPVIFVCENNAYATHAHIRQRQAKDNIAQRAVVFGVPAVKVNGNNVLEVFQAAKSAIRRARLGGGPTLIECRTYRWMSHVGPDYDCNLGYRSEDELKQWIKKCPLKVFQDLLIRKKAINNSELNKMLDKINTEIKEAVAFAKRSPVPRPQDLLSGVYRL